MMSRVGNTREAIFLASKRVFAGVGYDAASIDSVAAETGIIDRTLCSHFASKELQFQPAVRGAAELFLGTLPAPDREDDPHGEISFLSSWLQGLMTVGAATCQAHKVCSRVSTFSRNSRFRGSQGKRSLG